MTPTEAGLQHRIASAVERRHRDRAPARQRHGHRRAEHRPPGQHPHPGAGAGPAGHGAAQGADRQDGAPDASTRCMPRCQRRGRPARRAPRRLQGLRVRRQGRKAPSSCARRRWCAATNWSTRSPASTSAPTSRSSPSASTTAGARKFGNFTKDNVGRPFAIVLDDKVISAPVIREPILGGSGQISGSFTVETATQLAIQLRSGALPAKLTIVEERTVGPSLGADFDRGRQARRHHRRHRHHHPHRPGLRHLRHLRLRGPHRARPADGRADEPSPGRR